MQRERATRRDPAPVPRGRGRRVGAVGGPASEGPAVGALPALVVALSALLVAPAVRPAGAGAGATGPVCVLATGAAEGDRWAAVLGEHRLEARSVSVGTLSPDAFGDCTTVVVTSATSPLWSMDLSAATAFGSRKVLVMGAAGAPLLRLLGGPGPEGFRATTGRTLVMRPETRGDADTDPDSGPALLREPFPVAGGGGPLAIHRGESPLHVLDAAGPASTRALAPVAGTEAAPETEAVIALGSGTAFWGFGGAPEDLTPAGEALLADLVHRLAAAGGEALPEIVQARAAERDADLEADLEFGRELLAAAGATAESGAGGRTGGGLVRDRDSAPYAPPLSFLDSWNDGPESFSRTRGRITLFVFWATWCGYCKLELPEVEQLQHELARVGADVVAVSVDDRASQPRRYMSREGLEIPSVLAPSNANEIFGLPGVPSAVLVDRKGRVRATYRGSGDLRDRDVVGAARELARNG